METAGKQDTTGQPVRIKVGDIVERVNSDYKFVGTIRSVFQKNSGVTRYVVEDDRGILFIWSRKNFEAVGQPTA